MSKEQPQSFTEAWQELGDAIQRLLDATLIPLMTKATIATLSIMQWVERRVSRG